MCVCEEGLGEMEGGAKQLPPFLKRGKEYQSSRGHWGFVLPPAGMFAEIDPLFFPFFFSVTSLPILYLRDPRPAVAARTMAGLVHVIPL